MILQLFISFFLHAELVTINDFSQIPLTPKKVETLANIKKTEQRAQWRQCLTLIDQSWSQQPDLQPWLLNQSFFCARQGFLADPKSFRAAAVKVIRSYQKEVGRWRNGPWAKMTIERHSLLMDDVLASLSGKDYLKELDLFLAANSSSLSKEEKAKWLAKAGTELSSMNQKTEALLFFEMSVAQFPTSDAQMKMEQLRLALMPEANPSSLNAKKNDKVELGVESDWLKRIDESQKTKDVLLYLSDIVAYLNRFPGGEKASELQKQAHELYFEIQKRSETGQSDSRLVLERAITIFEKMDASRLIELARLTHRRSDFFASLRFAEKAIEILGSAQVQPIVLYVAGRSAQMLGENKKAQKFFESYLDRFPQGDDAEEVGLRLGLIFLRTDQIPSASAVIERVLSRGSDKLRLSLMYWLARAKEKSNTSAQASELKKKIIQEYPFSYFGLRLIAESNQLVLKWPDLANAVAVPRFGKVALLPNQLATLSRVRHLSRAGWFEEATEEWLQFIVPLDLSLKQQLVKMLVEDQMYLPAIRILNQLIDQNDTFRAREFIALGFPKPFAMEIESAARDARLSPRLVWSLIRQESGFYTRARSTSQAMGLMQLIPPTAKEVATKLKIPWRGPEDSYELKTNVRLGTTYLAEMIDQFQGSVPMALAAYNAGPTRVEKFLNARPLLVESILRPGLQPFDEIWFDELPWSETSFYVKAILRNALIYQLLEPGLIPESWSPRFWAGLHTRTEGLERQPQGRQK